MTWPPRRPAQSITHSQLIASPIDVSSGFLGGYPVSSASRLAPVSGNARHLADKAHLPCVSRCPRVKRTAATWGPGFPETGHRRRGCFKPSTGASAAMVRSVAGAARHRAGRAVPDDQGDVAPVHDLPTLDIASGRVVPVVSKTVKARNRLVRVFLLTLNAPII